MRLYWLLFKNTGKIEYYLKYKKAKEEFYERSTRDNTK